MKAKQLLVSMSFLVTSCLYLGILESQFRYWLWEILSKSKNNNARNQARRHAHHAEERWWWQYVDASSAAAFRLVRSAFRTFARRWLRAADDIYYYAATPICCGRKASSGYLLLSLFGWLSSKKEAKKSGSGMPKMKTTSEARTRLVQ